MVKPDAPRRYRAGVMPIFAVAASYTRELEPKPLAYVASLTVAPLRSEMRRRASRSVAA
jgi:hypothetical protein